MSEATQTSKSKTEYTPVVMTDGRTVQFPGKRKMLKERLIERGAGEEVEKVGVRFDFRNGNTFSAYIPEAHLYESAAHGYAQMLGDCVAGLRNEDGTPAGEDDMQLEIEGLHERLSAPGANWNEVSEGGGFGGASVLMKALMEWSGMAVEQVKEFLKGKTQAEKLALRDKADKPGKTQLTIKQIVERLEAEKKSKAAAVDTDALLAGLLTA